MFPFMPKSDKSRLKSKVKPKRKAEPELPNITSKPSYWIMLTLVTVVAASVFGLVTGITLLRIAVLAVTIVVLIGFVGYIRVVPSNLSLSKRATFLFVGASVIGFSIWAAIILASNATGFMLQIVNSVGEQFFVVTSLASCLAVGAFIGDLIGKNQRVQARFFP
jgi:hypothetical protein